MNAQLYRVPLTKIKRLLANKHLNTVIKFVFVALLAAVIYNQILSKDNIDEIWATFLASFSVQKIHWLVIAALLMPLNWAFETLKWQQLIKNFENLSFWQTYKAILAGVTFSIFTPNRVGEYGGRVLMVKAENNWKAVIATLVGSFSQLLILLAFGLLGLIFFINGYLKVDAYILYSILFLGGLSIALMLFCFFNVDLIVPIAKRIPYAEKFKRFVKHVKVLKKYTSKELGISLFFALARYVVYTLQYYFLLRFFGIDIPFFAAIASIATIFLFQTSIPHPPLTGLLLRGEIALEIWGVFEVNEISVFATTFGLWVLNLIIPALIGMIFIANINVLKSLGYDKKDNQV